ncbi:Tol-Pal system beta propeller repeat protein TolB [Paraphotobacterium marinum]|uniref:Tol-Pal system protein TolB n=1 Tax=Paraphotobacterium marinum TaxID=1755811 RepID=A0A220VE66_9GAMM|nr:Tol-Pal system beta propeller repeat protein TolB [Paraphotobacterium marinum]ASK78590.1 Tol-Pal system beta propeller repeat protein TolB [Paraphotobacterium marinum]
MKKKLIKLLSILPLVFCLPAFAELSLTITKGQDTAQPIAINSFDGNQGLSQNISEIISSDLQRSGKFSPLSQQDFPSKISFTSNVNGQAWLDKGVNDILVGKIERDSSGQYAISYKLIDAVKSTKSNSVVAQGLYRVQDKDLRRAAHTISNVIYQKILNEKGAFNTKIAYVTQPNNKKWLLNIADYDGYNPKTLLTSSEPILSPSWSPNLKDIAYSTFENNKEKIYIVNMYSGKRVLISDARGINSAPSFSPDGTKLALVLSKTGNAEIYIKNLMTGQLTQLTRGRSVNSEPSWSPDGNSIVFTSNRGGSPQIYKIDVSGSNVKRLTFEGRKNQNGRITPDGKTLINIRQTNDGYHLVKQNLETGATAILTSTFLDQSPTVAPNGSMIIYTATYGNQQDLSMVSIDGRFAARLPDSSGNAKFPSWSPFGK